jgi:hypothetical protein
MFAVYVRAFSWGAWGPSERWSLVARFGDRAAAEATAARVGGLLVVEPPVQGA